MISKFIQSKIDQYSDPRELLSECDEAIGSHVVEVLSEILELINKGEQTND